MHRDFAKLEIKQATLNDIDQIVELNVDEYWDSIDQWVLASQQVRWEQAGWWGDPYLLRWHFTVLNRCDGGILVAKVDDNIIGELDYTLSFDKTNDYEGLRAHIIWILVSKTHRRSGVAKQMISFLNKQLDVPIWVEPEDIRSKQLYENHGSPVHHISNWQLTFDDYQKASDDLDNVSMSIATDVIPLASLYDYLREHWEVSLGRYYAPCFDLTQLSNSEPVYEYIWGNTNGPDVVKYSTNAQSVIAILTQYPRVIIPPIPNFETLRLIFGKILDDIFNMGFSIIHVQVYNYREEILDILESYNFICTIENDPVYSISNV